MIMKICNFEIDIMHLPVEYENSYEKLPVELTDEEFMTLCIAQKDWMTSGEWYRNYPEVDEEYYLKKYCPEILAIVRRTLKEKAMQMWDERILSHLNMVGGYIPQEVWEENGIICFE
jgi:hypothetical protein